MILWPCIESAKNRPKARECNAITACRPVFDWSGVPSAQALEWNMKESNEEWIRWLNMERERLWRRHDTEGEDWTTRNRITSLVSNRGEERTEVRHKCTSVARGRLSWTDEVKNEPRKIRAQSTQQQTYTTGCEACRTPQASLLARQTCLRRSHRRWFAKQSHVARQSLEERKVCRQPRRWLATDHQAKPGVATRQLVCRLFWGGPRNWSMEEAKPLEYDSEWGRIPNKWSEHVKEWDMKNECRTTEHASDLQITHKLHTHMREFWRAYKNSI